MKVWLRPLGADTCKIRVKSREAAGILRDRLVERGASCSEPSSIAGHVGCAFYVERPSKKAEVERLLKDIPDVELMLDPA